MSLHPAKERNGSKAAFAELDRSNGELEERLGHDAALLQAERADMENLTHSISHDLRSPVHIISGFADLLSEHAGPSLDATSRHYLETIKRATVQIGQMMDDILSLSRLSRAELAVASVDLAALVARLVQEFEVSKRDRRIVWDIGRLPVVDGDCGMLRDAFGSLLSNALKATLSREVARIQVGSVDGESEVTVFVRDNGANVNLESRMRMFDDGVDGSHATGTRVGAVRLARVRRTFQMHGGHLTAETQPGGGVTFVATIPRNSPGAGGAPKPV
jgi:signal transduction histidine kinase